MKPRLLLALTALLTVGVPATAQNNNPDYCASPDSQAPTTVVWPDSDLAEPIWELEFLPPSSSSGPRGSGLEIRNVKYNGRLVLKRGHVPVLNVKYESGCYGFRDWSDYDKRFVADNPMAGNACYAESTPGTVQTMCDAAPANCTDTNGDGEVDDCDDIGNFSGVAAERFPDMLRLTTHMTAGWYRYTMKWEFHRDGTIRPIYGFATTGSSCTQNPRRHHAYWRFDFDIEGADRDYIVESSDVADDVVFENEALRTWGEPSDGVAWSVLDLDTERGYRLVPGDADYDTPVNPNTGIPAVDNFVSEDAVVARYAPGELRDGGGTAADFTVGDPPIVNSEDVYDADVVLWYRSGSTKPDIDPGTCYVVGPVLTPVGDWSANTVASEQAATPTGFTLEDAYPNPFDRTTTVRFSVDVTQPVTLTLYDAVGRQLRTLYEGTPTAGVVESVMLDGSDLPSGVYTVRLAGASLFGSTRIVLLK